MPEIARKKPHEQLDELESSLQQYLAHPPFWLRFPPAIDDQFEELGQPIRLARFLKVGWLSLLCFDLLAICDYLSAPTIFATAWIVRFLLVTPLSIIILFALPQKWMVPWRGWVLSSLLFFAGLGLSIMQIATPTPDAEYFHLQWLLLLLTGNLLFRLRFRVAVAVSALLFLIYAVTVLFFMTKPLISSLNTIVLMGAVSAISLIVKYRMELDNRIAYALKSLHKITQYRLERANRKLSRQAARDSLTGLYNRRTLDENYGRLWRQAARKSRPISVIFIDVDYFKRYNDSYGHAAGDECLCWLAKILQTAAQRPLDFAARFGGEEFVVVLPDTHPAEAGIIAEQIRARVLSSQRPHTGSPEGCVTISIGVAGGIPATGDNLTDYIEQADSALYIAKTQGRNRVRYGHGGTVS